jgi:Flp pilus assembly protein TadB
MAERINTGGTTRIVRNKEDDRRVRAEDTSSTRQFKQGLRKWQDQKELRRAHEKKNKRMVMLFILILIIIAVALLIYRYWL